MGGFFNMALIHIHFHRLQHDQKTPNAVVALEPFNMLVITRSLAVMKAFLIEAVDEKSLNVAK